MKKFTAVLLSIMFLAVCVKAEERNAPPAAHFTLAGMFAVAAVVHYDRAVKYQERADLAFSTGSVDGYAHKSRADKMRFRASLLTAAAGCFLVTGSVQLVIDEGLVGVRKQIRF